MQAACFEHTHTSTHTSNPINVKPLTVATL